MGDGKKITFLNHSLHNPLAFLVQLFSQIIATNFFKKGNRKPVEKVQVPLVKVGEMYLIAGTATMHDQQSNVSFFRLFLAWTKQKRRSEWECLEKSARTKC